MSNRSGHYRHYRRRRRGSALFGITAFASVIILALGGLTLVGLDTMSSQGIKISRVAQPEVAQVPEVTREQSSGDQSSEGQSEEQKSSKEEQASASGDKASSNESASSEKSSEEAASQQKSGEKKASESSEAASAASKEDSSDKQEDKEKKDKKQEAKKQEKKEPEAPPPPQNKDMWMSVPRLGMYSDTVYNSDKPSTMDVGAIKLPPTGFPWQDNANTYISAHRIGYPGTQSYNQFYALPAMQNGDAVYLTDANGTTYEYRVTDKFAVKPWENWVTEPQPGGDMVTLQTCVDSLDPNTWWDITPKLMRSGPDSARLIVQAEKVETYPPQGY